MPNVRASLSLGCLLLSGVASSPATASITQGTIVTLPGWNGTPERVDLPPTAPRCATTAFQVLGQAWRVDFSTGGVIPNWRRAPVLANTVYEPRLAKNPQGPGIFPKLGAPKMPASRTTIVVVDSFEPVEVRVTATAPDKPVPQRPPLALKLRHGGLVVTHLKKLLLNDGFRPAGQSRDQLTFARDTQTVTIRWVSIDQAGTVPDSTQAIADRLLTILNEPDARAGNVIVHMSLALVPCPVLDSYKHGVEQKAQLPSPERYPFSAFVEDVVKLNPGLGRQGVLRAMLQDAPTGEPLLVALDDARRKVNDQNLRNGTSHQFIAVASSGNFGLEISTLPGARSGVISVGATSWTGGAPGLPGIQGEKPERNWSDQGNVSAVGEWFTLSTQALSEGCSPSMRFWCVAPATDLKNWPNFAYRGTSFSAPSVTALLASRLPSVGAAQCLPPSTVLSRRAVDTRCF